MEKATAQKIIKIIKGKLPKNSKILCLSLTGSRAFGWADEKYDYDIHGSFAAKDYWDTVHSGEEGFDINLWELNHLYSDIQYQHFIFFMNISNPFYIHPKFDYKGLMKFCTFQAAKEAAKMEISQQINFFKDYPQPRVALHAYRSLMVPIYFLKRKKFELNIYKINKNYYHFKQLENLKTAYTQGGEKWNLKEVKKDLEKLTKEYQRLSKKREEKLDLQKAQKWLERMKKVFYKK